jgi:transposase InsO family protein
VVSVWLKKWDLFSSVGEKMRKGPKETNAKEIEKHRYSVRRKIKEDHFQKKRFLVAQHRTDGLSVRNIAERIRMSVGFVHKWCLRLKTQIESAKKAISVGRYAVKYPEGKGIREAIVSRSTAPNNPRRKITEAHRDAIREVRKERFTKRMGAQKIREYRKLDISHQSINKILKEEGLTAPRRKRKQRKFDPFRRENSNSLWQIDYKEFERGVYMLSVKDDHSSAILAADVRATCRTDDVLEIMKKAVRTFGPPHQILSDHGTQWYSSKGEGCRFDEWCSGNGIEHIMGRVKKPTTQGKIERWHGTVLEEAELPPKGSPVVEYGKAVLEYMEFYNTRRPHHGIDLQIPLVVYMAGIKLPDIISELDVHEVS